MAFIKDFFDAFASFGKVLLLSGIPSKPGAPKNSRLIIMGNGPSLRDTIANQGALLTSSDTLAVNFAANSPEFPQLKPDLYVIADPLFFIVEKNGQSGNPNIVKLWENIASAGWNMTLYLPIKAKVPESIEKNPHIRIKRFNMTPGEGMRGPVHWLYRRGLAMPRPRNILIASLMVALREGYRDIALVGADHTWSRDLWVDDHNRVITVQKHFYQESKQDLDRVTSFHQQYHLHDILNSLTIAFRSYHQIAAYASTLGARIVNCTPGSFIDAFPRETLEGEVQKEK